MLLLLCFGFGNWDWGIKALSACARLLVFLCIFLEASPEAALIIVRPPIYDDNVKLVNVVFVQMGILFYFVLIAYFLSWQPNREFWKKWE